MAVLMTVTCSCGSAKLVECVQFSEKSWMGHCEECGKAFSIDDVTDKVEGMIRLTKERVAKKISLEDELSSEILARAYDILADFRCPKLCDFSDLGSEEQILEEFKKLWGYSGNVYEMTPRNAQYMCKRVEEISLFKVNMESADFYTGIKGTNSGFLLTSTDGRTMKIAFGPYSEPFVEVQ